ncbi:ribosomal protein S18-alanine N-acetyltransferase [Alkalibacter rhizosphaerae]|nr:ribosomal protein S18-alanine N-acetyltransferase [Alkalibacter rhizosphaerae]
MDRPMTMKVEPMSLHHLDAILSLERSAFAIPWSRGMFEEELKNPLARYYVLQLESQVVGYAGMWVVLNEGHITNIAVAPSNRRMGIGKRLLEHLLGEGEKMGVDSFTLEVRKSNGAALALYGSCGFVPAGIRKKYYSDNGEDAVIMWRNHG